MEPLTSAIMFAMISLVQVRGPVTDADRLRLQGKAEVIAAAVHETPQLPFRCSSDESRCDDAERASALALVTIAWHESGFADDVEDCSRCNRPGTAACDRGTSMTAYQMKRAAWNGHTKEEVCSDPKLAARLALWQLARRDVPIEAAYLAYAGRAKTGKELIDLFRRLAAKAALRVSSAGKGRSFVVADGDGA